MFEFLIQNNLITPNQSSFKTGNPCIYQLISITHELYKSFDDSYEVRGVYICIYVYMPGDCWFYVTV